MVKVKADLLLKAAEERNWSKSKLAIELNLSRMHLNRLLNGENAGNKAVFNILKKFPEFEFEDIFFLSKRNQNVPGGKSTNSYIYS